MVPTPASTRRIGRAGFTLLEALAVLTIIGIMTVLAMPALKGFSGSLGRKGAVTLLLNTFEQARVAALTSGTTVYVGFADSEFPQQMRYRALIVFRDRLDSDPVPVSGTLTDYIALTKWTELPKGISFRKDTGSDYTLVSTDLEKEIPKNNLPQVSAGEKIPVLVFNSSGFIETDSGHLRLMIYEGFHGPSGPSFTSPDKTYFDMVGLRKYTGRAELFLAQDL